MSGPPRVVVILCTAPTEGEAARLANGLLDARIAACVSVIPGALSFYRWQGKSEQAQEFQLVVKTSAAREAEVIAWLEAAHSFDVPELLSLPAMGGSERYLNWVVESCKDAGDPS